MPTPPVDGDPRHGRYSTYVNLGCRCDLCRAANRAASAKTRQRLRQVDLSLVEHGKVSTYSNYGCRCQPCRDVHNAAGQERKARRKAEEERGRALKGQRLREWRFARGEVDKPHGDASTYSNYGCRCEPCKDAHRVKMRRYHMRKRVAKKLAP